MSSSYYTEAAVCRRGHVETTVIDNLATLAKRCPECGAPVLTACSACDTRIRGDLIVPEVITFAEDYKPPDFCDQCGAPFPWVSRQGRIYELMNLLDHEDLDPATELEVREQLEALTQPDLPDDEAARRWERVRAKAPTLWERSGAQRILETVVTAAIKAQLDLK